MAVGPEQKMAARALGLGRFRVFWHVVWPQAFRVAIPPLMNSAVALLKDTALVSVITVPEVVMEAQNIISITFDPMPYYLVVAGMFFVFTYPLMLLAGRLERRIREKGFADA
jgi:ABC-type amino acid transport system permease subunit